MSYQLPTNVADRPIVVLGGPGRSAVGSRSRTLPVAAPFVSTTLRETTA